MKIACQNRLPPIAPDIIITRLASSENWNGRKRGGYFNFRLASDFFSSLSIHRFPIRPVFRDNNFSLREKRVKKRVKKFHKDLISTNRTLVSYTAAPPPLPRRRFMSAEEDAVLDGYPPPSPASIFIARKSQF